MRERSEDEKELLIKIGKRIQVEREKTYTQEKFAELIGVSAKTISAYECGMASPPITKLIKICEILNISIDTILKGNTSTPTLDDQIKRLLESKNETQKKLLYVLLKALLDYISILIR